MQHDSPQVHPENCCHRFRGALYDAAKRENSTDITGSQREAFHWSEHSPGECCICKHITEMVNLKWVEMWMCIKVSGSLPCGVWHVCRAVCILYLEYLYGF